MLAPAAEYPLRIPVLTKAAIVAGEGAVELAFFFV